MQHHDDDDDDGDDDDDDDAAAGAAAGGGGGDQAWIHEKKENAAGTGDPGKIKVVNTVAPNCCKVAGL